MNAMVLALGQVSLSLYIYHAYYGSLKCFLGTSYEGWFGSTFHPPPQFRSTIPPPQP